MEGILSCAEVLVVSLIDWREKYIFGRRTMHEMERASASCAIQNRWLAARAAGLGMGLAVRSLTVARVMQNAGLQSADRNAMHGTRAGILRSAHA